MDYREVYRQWSEAPYFDEETRKELLAIEGDEKEIEDRFYRQRRIITLQAVLNSSHDCHSSDRNCQ